MKVIFVLIFAAFLSANAQDAGEAIALLFEEKIGEMCGDENLKSVTADCYNSLPEWVLQPAFDCANVPYMDGEAVLREMCDGEVEAETGNEQEQRDCIENAYKENKPEFQDSEIEAMKQGCSGFIQFVEESGMMESIMEIIRQAQNRKK